MASSPGRLFNVTIWNPSGSDKTFKLTETVTNPSGYPLQWIRFDCQSAPGCQAGPGEDNWLSDNDKALITTPSLTSGSVSIYIDAVARSGSFPVTFVAIDSDNGNTYSTLATILIFAEGLSEFAAWQLVGLLIIAIIFIAYFNMDMKGKKTKRRK